eukprot:GGOE01053209.1.p1 GENE.GGOE01053209.1~~GGOE01053209.1.p1  ORF type:complete len:278 (-),score=77.18 GGOE01053209.1:157-990(-)
MGSASSLQPRKERCYAKTRMDVDIPQPGDAVEGALCTSPAQLCHNMEPTPNAGDTPDVEYFRSRAMTNEVLKGKLYIGDLSGMLNGDWRRFHVDTIVSVLSAASEEVAEVLARHPGVQHMYYLLDDCHMSDSEGQMSILNAAAKANVFHALEFMWRAISSGSRVMIHCEQGKQRSAVVCCAFLIWWQGYSVKEAIQQMQERRKGVRIPGMWRTELSHIARLARGLHPTAHCDPEEQSSNTMCPMYQRVLALAKATDCCDLLRELDVVPAVADETACC